MMVNLPQLIIDNWTWRRIRPVLVLWASIEAARRNLVPGQTALLEIIHDASGNGFHATQPNESLRLTLVHDSIRWVFRNPGGRWMSGPVCSSSPVTHIVSVVTNVSPFVNEQVFFSQAHNGADLNYSCRVGVIQGRPCMAQRNGITDTLTRVRATGVAVQNQTLYQFNYETTGSAYKIYKDSVLQALSVEGTNNGEFYAQTQLNEYCLFARSSNVGNALGFTGDLCGVMVGEDVIGDTADMFRVNRWAYQEAIARDYVTIDAPASFHTQQAGNDGTATVTVRGRTVGRTPVGGIEVLLDGVVHTAPVVDGEYEVEIADVSGQVVEIVARHADVPTILATRSYLGVGHNIAVAGASNHVSQLENEQVYTPFGGLKARVHDQAHRWREAEDHCSSKGTTDGSIWPLIATELLAHMNAPIASHTLAEGGAGSDRWKPGGSSWRQFIAAIEASNCGGLSLVDMLAGGNDMQDDRTVEYMRDHYVEFIRAVQAALPFDTPDEITDVMTDADGTSIEAHDPQWIAGNGSLEIQDNVLVTTDPGDSAAAQGSTALIDTGAVISNQALRFRLAENDTHSPGLLVRANEDTGAGWFITYKRGPRVLSIMQWDGSAVTGIEGTALSALAFDTDYWLEAFTAGDHIRGRLRTDIDGEPGDLLAEVRKAEVTGITNDRFGGPRLTTPYQSVSKYRLYGKSSFPMVLSISGYFDDPDATREKIDVVRLGQLAAIDFDPVNIKPGAVTTDMGPLIVNLNHYATQAEAEELVERKTHFLKAALDGTPARRGPRFVSATRVDATHIDVTFNVASGLAVQPSMIGWRILDNGALRAVSACSQQASDRLRLTVDAIGDAGTRTISYASMNDAAGGTLRDSGVPELSAEPFIDQVIA